MPNTIDHSLPVVVVCNISETFYEFLSRGEDAERQIRGEQYRGDRAIVWAGDPKLVFTSLPIPHAEHLYQQAGFAGTEYLAPQRPTSWLSLDILREPALLNRLIEYAGEQRALQLIPYAATDEFLQLVEALEAEHGLTVILPESPRRDGLWLRDYIDSKIGFRILASRWLPDADTLLPEGLACQTLDDAAHAARWFLSNGRACLVKSDIGENGIGNVVIHPDQFDSVEAIAAHLRASPYLNEHWLTVEELIAAEHPLSPSLEVYVPPEGDPQITYVSDQLFQGFGDFCGVLVSRELTTAPWYAPLAESGLVLARHLQAMGYVGHFDLDCVVNDDRRLYLLEINPRRTGGTHVHEFAVHVFGADYLSRVALLSNDTLSSGSISDFDELLSVIGDFQYPMDGENRGVFLIVTSALEAHEFGAIIAGADTAEVVEIQRQVQARIAEYREAVSNQPSAVS
ncbi:MAG: hypothetical protein IT319_14065 [Anaerolineae bacterium]|nr:hypothetical protein [Anaerolineae bacterium]